LGRILLPYLASKMSWVSSDSIVSWVWAGRPGGRGSTHGRGKGFFL
jgi:hypothetical protein